DTQVVLGETLYYSIPNTNYAFDGNPGQGGAGRRAGSGGQCGAKVCQTTFVNGNCMATSSNRGGAGLDGFDGIPGNPGAQGNASFVSGFYIPGDGSVGNPGQSNGGAGGGGGGGGGKGCEPAAVHPLTGDTVFFTSGTGGGGGGGGEGGQRGEGGLGGTGGGASFCVFIYNNGLNGIIQDCVYNPGQGGQGGAGGPGGQGGQGGQGGLGGVIGDNGPNHSCNNGEGGQGGQGGRGGQGGQGGKGSDGMSAGLYEMPGGMPVMRPYSYNPFAPQINVEYFGCTNSSVTATTNASGQIAWLFGYGAVPQTINGNNVTVEYTNPLGYRNITLVVDGVPYFYANFINLETNFNKPVIQASRKTICVGQSTNLSTAAAADSYNWTIPGSSLPNSIAAAPGDVTYDTPGLYPVTLEITTCCGISRVVDTIRVLSSVQPMLGKDTAICYLEPLPYFHANGYAGASYEWTSNGGAFGADTNIVRAGGPGEYTVTIDYGNGCVGSDTIQFDVFTTLPLGLEDTTICLNAPFPLLDANYFGGSYSWTLDGNAIGTNSQTLQSTIPGNYAVTVTAPSGCQGSDNIQVAISDPRVNLGFDVTICSNEGMPVLNAQNIGSSYAWTLNGNPTGGNTQTLLTTTQGQYGVTITDPYGCQASDAMILTLTPSITTGINGPTTISAGVPASFQDATVPGATSWIWSFGDGTPLVTTSTAPHTFTEGGEFPVFLISSNGICSDTATSVVNVLWNCTALGLTAAIESSTDTVYLSDLGTVVLMASGVNAESFQWNLGDGNFSYEDTLVYAYASPGTYTITLTSYNYNCSTTVNQTLVVVQSHVGVENPLWNDTQVIIFPNPFSNSLTVQFSSSPAKDVQVVLTNTLGQEVYRTESKPNTCLSLSLPELRSGIYYLSLHSGENSARYKIIKE
ncbi:MAG: T9SS type A sorting domain-containing protein, partial [Bacteroidia bacterium]|nr:T9SS type A sorting domain-containing protein [Bacteroidia bacterium]